MLDGVLGGTDGQPHRRRVVLHAHVEQAHAAGYRVRFWATHDIAGPARENLWRELQAAGVDHINTDDLPGLQDHLTR
ncbi:hypothetical protein [Kocuria sp. KH4]